MRTNFITLALVAVAVALPARGAAQGAADNGYAKSSTGLRDFDKGALKFRVLLDSAALKGGEMEMVEITFPANSPGGAHTHTRLEVIYVLDGEMDHVVNGVAHHLMKGSVAVVRPGDTVVHKVTSSVPVRALVIWTPGGELKRVEGR